MKPIGTVRRAQVITTYGVGGMIAIDEASYIVAGLDSWKLNKQQRIIEPRLQSALRVAELYLPPSENSFHGAAVRRFPEMYSCQGGSCNLLQEHRRFGGGSACVCGGSLIPSRFVVACEDGHLDDFPYRAWVHRGSEDGWCDRALHLVSTGRSASLRSIEIICECGRKASMEGAFRRSELGRLGIKCRGGRPWLGSSHRMAGCTKPPRTMQRGSSAAWFGVVRSSLAIPPWSSELHQMIDERFDMLAGESDETIARMAEKAGWLKGNVTAQHVIDAVRRREQLTAGVDPDDDGQLDDTLKVAEYEQLCTPATDDEIEQNHDFECVPAVGDPPAPQIVQVMQVNRLREVRALQAFTRVEPPSPADAGGRRASLSIGQLDWLPAMEVRGEGVFIRLDPTRLQSWESSTPVRERAGRIVANHQKLLDRRASTTGRDAPMSEVTPRTLLIHTIAHLLINEWSLDSGYSASAMRERLYTTGEMAGFLIYTATSDSAGSLGGIVRQATSDRLGRTLASALSRAEWCSADPLCMEADAAGADSLNLAACHVCSLLPETSCEHNNTLLDRGLVVGWPGSPQSGFFSA
ncbi:DrmB family protein [Paractinoplanes maris]|uniref:DrmB family protein n=1 Tax=Paractinoplanes maris TaxID=1734446 RepID=UPI002020629B|nr:DUF1998 domain-containing protein [Actinoplanes maris]